jgi:hypothetical protein
LLKDQALKSLIVSPRLNDPQKAKAILRFLRSKIFPELKRAEADFRKKIVSLHLPKDVSLDAPPYFEGAQYRLDIRFRNGKDLREKIGRLSIVEGLERLGEPWEEVGKK